MQISFRSIIETIGSGPLSKAFQTSHHHVWVMATRDSVPKKYWPALIKVAKAEKPELALTEAKLEALRKQAKENRSLAIA